MARKRAPGSRRRITLELPPELMALCERDGVDPQTVLRGFAADLAQIIDWAHSPRTDGYASNGSDERRYAMAYYERVGYPWMNRRP